MSFDSRRSKATRLPTNCVTSLISNTSIASEMLCPPLAEQVRYYKETEGGVENMNNELREFWEEKMRKAVEKAERSKALKTAKRMLASNKYSLEEIAEINDLTLDEVKNLESQHTA